MDCINIEHFNELLANLSRETRIKIFADMWYATNDIGGFSLPEPKNEVERTAMEKFHKHSKSYETVEDLANRPRVFPFLAE